MACPGNGMFYACRHPKPKKAKTSTTRSSLQFFASSQPIEPSRTRNAGLTPALFNALCRLGHRLSAPAAGGSMDTVAGAKLMDSVAPTCPDHLTSQERKHILVTAATAMAIGEGCQGRPQLEICPVYCLVSQGKDNWMEPSI